MDAPIHLSKIGVYTKIGITLVSVAWFIFNLTVYLTADDEFTTKSEYGFFLQFILTLTGISTFMDIQDAVYKFKHRDETITYRQLPVNQPCSRLIYELADIGIFIVRYLIADSYAFFPTNIDICPDMPGKSTLTCLVLQLQSWAIGLYLIWLGLMFGFALLLFVSVKCCPGCIQSVARKLQRIRNHASEMRIIEFISRTMPITSDAPDNACSICLEEPKEGDQWRALLCSHKFHPECIDPWLRENPHCPLCRTPIEGGNVPLINDENNV